MEQTTKGRQVMVRTIAAWLLTFLVGVVICDGCPGIEIRAGEEPKRSELEERFKKVRPGMSAAEVEEVLGEPEQVIPHGDHPSHRIHVWRERWLGIPRSLALVKLEDDRVVIASYSSKNFKDPVAWVEDIERRTGKRSS
jgi:hypothetical protein